MTFCYTHRSALAQPSSEELPPAARRNSEILFLYLSAVSIGNANALNVGDRFESIWEKIEKYIGED